MKNVLRLQLAVLGLAAFGGSVRPANAQPPCSGVGMSLGDVAQRKWGRSGQDPADFKAWSDGIKHSFVAPGEILPIGPGHFYLIDNKHQVLYMSISGGALTGSSRLNNSLTNYVAMTWDGTNLFVLDQNEVRVVQKSGTLMAGFSFPSGNPYDIIFDGQSLWILEDSSTGPLLVRAVYDPSAGPNGKMTFTSKPIGRSSLGRSAKLAFDGRYVWVAAGGGTVYKFDELNLVAQYKLGYTGDPQSLTFDGYSMWVSDSANTIYRFRTSDGSVLSSVSSLGSPRGMAFDGSYMLVTDRTNGLLSGYLACDTVPMLPYTVPASPEHAAFDGANYWVSSPLSKTVSIR